MANLNFPEVKDRDPNAEVDMEVLNDTIEYIRPAVQADGGDIKLASVENGVVNIEMLGACQGCPMSIATLKSGIERILKDKVPGVVEVIASWVIQYHLLSKSRDDYKTRLHDRIVFTLSNDQWTKSRLYP